MQKIANRIIICGVNGAGKSTFGKSLAETLGYQFRDIENYYFSKTDKTISMQLRAHGRKWADCRIQRVKDRSFQKFGSRMLPGGDLYEKEKAFLEMAENRPDAMAEDWLKSTSIPVIRLDGTKPVTYNIEEVRQYVQNINCG